MPAPTILAIEDEAALRGLVRLVLAGAGYTVLEAGGGAEALGLAAGHPGPIQLVITDVAMPGLRGPEVAARLAALRPEARILFMSGAPSEAAGHRGALPAGARLLRKPFTVAELLQRVREALS